VTLKIVVSFAFHIDQSERSIVRFQLAVAWFTIRVGVGLPKRSLTLQS
jgi:hypothetical protein